jgi:hypothetical protein
MINIEYPTMCLTGLVTYVCPFQLLDLQVQICADIWMNIEKFLNYIISGAFFLQFHEWKILFAKKGPNVPVAQGRPTGPQK